jgi:hypothetical protein
MRKFKIFAGCESCNCPNHRFTDILEVEDNTSEEEIEHQCEELIECLLESVVYGGWEEVT